MDTQIIIGVVSAVAAIGAAGVSWMAANRSDKSTARQQRLATHAAVAEWSRDLREWASQCVDVLSEASYTCHHHDESGVDCLSQLRECRYRISALVDRGRFFLPNQSAEGIGATNPTAYRGYRHAALDPLVAAERVMSGEVGAGKYQSRELALIEMRRVFVSAIQEILGPESNNKEIARMIREGNEQRAADQSLGGLLAEGAPIPTGAERLLFESSDKHRRPTG
ncbi:MAG: hypothetical protein ABI852_05110 [Gemmatimonadaceae bacterium]